MIRRIIFTGWILQVFFIVSVAHANTIGYVAMGDSYTVGTGIQAKDAWPSQLVRRLTDSGIDIKLAANLGENGWTARQAIDRELSLLANLKPDFVTLLIGVNDWIQGVTSQDFTNRVRVLMDEIQEKLSHPGKLLVVTIPDFSCSPQGKKWGYGKSATNGITRLNKILTTEAVLRNLPVVDIYPLSREACSQPGMFSGDGLHPSVQQYSRWVDRIFPAAFDLLKFQKN